MKSPQDLLKALGIPSHDDPDMGTYFASITGAWLHTCVADFPFQADVELVFDMAVKTEEQPLSMPANVAWIQEQLGEIWNAAAQAINELVEARRIEMEG